MQPVETPTGVGRATAPPPRGDLINHGAVAGRPPFSTGIVAALVLRLKLLNRARAARQSLGHLPLVGGMSSIPSRAATLPLVLDRVAPQLDRLHLFLHGYDSIPDGIERANVTVTLGARDHPYRASGKFLGLTAETAPCMYFGFDDDILYASDHVARLRAALMRYRGRALVGIHGVTFRPGATSFLRHGRRHHFRSRALFDRVVDLIGVGTCAFVSTAFSIAPPSWQYGDMDDLMLALDLETLSIPRVCVARPRRSLVMVEGTQEESLWKQARRDSTRQDAQVARLMALIAARR